jgi:hypothetical protein
MGLSLQLLLCSDEILDLLDAIGEASQVFIIFCVVSARLLGRNMLVYQSEIVIK